jgi:hypothetical protein
VPPRHAKQRQQVRGWIHEIKHDGFRWTVEETYRNDATQLLRRNWAVTPLHLRTSRPRFAPRDRLGRHRIRVSKGITGQILAGGTSLDVAPLN